MQLETIISSGSSLTRSWPNSKMQLLIDCELACAQLRTAGSMRQISLSLLGTRAWRSQRDKSINSSEKMSKLNVMLFVILGFLIARY